MNGLIGGDSGMCWVNGSCGCDYSWQAVQNCPAVNGSSIHMTSVRNPIVVSPLPLSCYLVVAQNFPKYTVRYYLVII